MCRFYEMNPILKASEEELWDDEKESDWEGCCEDPYDDEDEEVEREWCD